MGEVMIKIVKGNLLDVTEDIIAHQVNCMGSGTTAIAAINTNRNYIGFELDTTYYNLANERIQKHKIKI